MMMDLEHDQQLQVQAHHHQLSMMHQLSLP